MVGPRARLGLDIIWFWVVVNVRKGKLGLDFLHQLTEMHCEKIVTVSRNVCEQH